jgi:hypothetical protein
MRTLSVILVLCLGILGAQFASAQDSFPNLSSGPKAGGPDALIFARLELNKGNYSFLPDNPGEGPRIDTSRLVWEPDNSNLQNTDDQRRVALVYPARPSSFTPGPANPPNAPSADYEANIVHNSPSYAPEPPRNLDWRFLTAHGVYAGAVIFDDLITMKGLGRPCGFVEGNSDLGPNPSAQKMAIHGLVEFAAVTTMDYFLKRTHVPGLSYIGAGIGTAKHLHGGIQWLNTGCF